MNIVIAGNFLFPSGSATANRIRNLSLGLESCGASVHVLPMTPVSLNDENGDIKRFSQKITYEHLITLGRNNKNIPMRNSLAGKPIWLVSMYSSIISVYRRLAQLIRDEHCNLFIGYGRNAVQLTPLANLCRKNGIITLLDVVELRQQFSGFGGRLNPIYWDWYLGEKWMPRLFDGVTVIAQALAPVYEQAGCRESLVVPSLEVWGDSSPVHRDEPKGEFQLAYVGALLPRDAPQVLFDAMRILGEKQISVTLKVLGGFREVSEGQRWVKICEEDPILRRNVKLIGRVSDDELKTHLSSANGLILTRRNASTEIASFPTRLVEYLKQARPVFISKVGDIQSYLSHGQDAILLDPENANEVANAIAFAAANVEMTRAIGLQGYRRGKECFNCVDHAAKILQFSEKLQQVKFQQ